MGNTTIEWTVHAVKIDRGNGEEVVAYPGKSFNPWIGCTKVSPGCKFCYAEDMAARYFPGTWGPDNPRRFPKQDYWKQLVTWNNRAKKLGVSLRVFVGSMCDIMEDRQDLEAARDQLFTAVDHNPYLDFLFLTKRPENYKWLLPEQWLRNPRKNVWLGTSIETQEQDHRLASLLAVPAWVRFISAEPLLGPLDLAHALCPTGINWLIVGGESGNNARPMHPDWPLHLLAQAEDAKIPFFFKQWGTWKPGRRNDMKPGDLWLNDLGNSYPLELVGTDYESEYTPMIKGSKKANGRDLIPGRKLAATPYSWNEASAAVRLVGDHMYAGEGQNNDDSEQ